MIEIEYNIVSLSCHENHNLNNGISNIKSKDVKTYWQSQQPLESITLLIEFERSIIKEIMIYNKTCQAIIIEMRNYNDQNQPINQKHLEKVKFHQNTKVEKVEVRGEEMPYTHIQFEFLNNPSKLLPLCVFYIHLTGRPMKINKVQKLGFIGLPQSLQVPQKHSHDVNSSAGKLNIFSQRVTSPSKSTLKVNLPNPPNSRINKILGIKSVTPLKGSDNNLFEEELKTYQKSTNKFPMSQATQRSQNMRQPSLNSPQQESLSSTDLYEKAIKASLESYEKESQLKNQDQVQKLEYTIQLLKEIYQIDLLSSEKIEDLGKSQAELIQLQVQMTDRQQSEEIDGLNYEDMYDLHKTMINDSFLQLQQTCKHNKLISYLDEQSKYDREISQFLLHITDQYQPLRGVNFYITEDFEQAQRQRIIDSGQQLGGTYHDILDEQVNVLIAQPKGKYSFDHVLKKQGCAIVLYQFILECPTNRFPDIKKYELKN